MNARACAVLAPILALLVACETTGDPRQGGLFGWSEAKARERQAQRRLAVGQAESELRRETAHGSQLEARGAGTAHRLAAASAEREQSATQLRAREAAVSAKAARLETESPTAATASRARRLRQEADAVAANRSLSASERARQLREIESEIDAARANLAR